MSREREMAVAAANPAETPRLREPEMQFCPICEVCTEIEDMVNVRIPGGDGEANRMCWGCADARGLLS